MVEMELNELASRGEEIYKSRLRRILEPVHIGEFVAIEVESGDYFLGDSPAEAVGRARERYTDRLFHLMRIGYPVSVKFKTPGSEKLVVTV